MELNQLAVGKLFLFRKNLFKRPSNEMVAGMVLEFSKNLVGNIEIKILFGNRIFWLELPQNYFKYHVKII